jgi:hypothetical protein
MDSPNVVSTSVGIQTPTYSAQQSTAPVTNSIVTVPIPVISNDSLYTYVFVRGSLFASYSAVFGASDVENEALSKRFHCSSAGIENGIEIKTPPSKVINSLAQLGYRVVCSTGKRISISKTTGNDDQSFFILLNFQVKLKWFGHWKENFKQCIYFLKINI